MNIKNVYILDDRAILYINGEDAKEFLQNLISNDINKVSDVNSCFSSLLTPQGKFLYEFIIIKHKSGYFWIVKNLRQRSYSNNYPYIS